ncbi:MAG: NAD(P)/FAD-dependent oxidoreductase [Epsilonproteobacteria bacterium]|nr:NAD(P)/FAD-dependent oxidoreductase [Campylobacterota bacterium]
MKQRHIIIGVSAAGLGAAVKLRALDKDVEIICLSAEQEMPYNRCLLADYLAGSKDQEAVRTKKEDFFQQNKIELMLDARVARLDRKNKQVILHDGRELTYDKLLIGSGRSIRLPELEGIDGLGVHPFYNLHDVTKILSFVRARDAKHVTVVGAGLSGLECADALKDHGVSIHIIERESKLLSRQIDQGGSDFLIELAKKHEVNLTLNTSVEKIDINEDQFVKGVCLTSGSYLKTDMVVFAIGGRPNSDFAKQAGITTHFGGIVTSKTMQTNDEDVYAAGDVCVVTDLLTKESVQTCLWPDSVMQGMAAAYGMVGQKKIYPGTLVVTSSHIFGTTFVTAGPVADQGHNFKELIQKNFNFYHKYLVDDNNSLKGFVMIGNVSNVGALRKKLLDGSGFDLSQLGT